MGNFWRLTPRFLASPNGPPSSWPATLTLKFALQPDDYFGINASSAPRTSFATDFKIAFDHATRKVFIERASMPSVMRHDFSDSNAQLYFEGNVGTFSMEMESLEHLNWNLKWITEDVVQSLSLHTGIYFEFESITGTIGDKEISVLNPAEDFSLIVGFADAAARVNAFTAALDLPGANNPSYRRFEIGCRYFRHALRLVSQRQVNFSPAAVHSEVVLNLVKCMETVFATTNRDIFRKYFRALGISDAEIESQLIPITLMRNELDVGHPSSGFSAPDEVRILRQFVDRSIQNVGTILQLALKRILIDPEFLLPMCFDGSEKRAKFVSHLEKYLQLPALKALHGPVVVKVVPKRG